MKTSKSCRTKTICFSLLALLACWQTAAAQATRNSRTADSTEKQAPSMGPLTGMLKEGNQGAWFGQFRGPVFRLVNPKDANAIKYFFVETDPKVNGHRTIEVNVASAKGDGMTGLLYGFNDKPKEYYMLVLDRSGTIRLFHRTSAGIKQKFSMTPGKNKSKPSTGQVQLTKLTMVEDGDSVKILVNDKSIGSFEGKGTGKGAVGIVAVGIVDALFHEFDIKTDK